MKNEWGENEKEWEATREGVRGEEVRDDRREWETMIAYKYIDRQRKAKRSNERQLWEKDS